MSHECAKHVRGIQISKIETDFKFNQNITENIPLTIKFSGPVKNISVSYVKKVSWG